MFITFLTRFFFYDYHIDCNQLTSETTSTECIPPF